VTRHRESSPPEQGRWAVRCPRSVRHHDAERRNNDDPYRDAEYGLSHAERTTTRKAHTGGIYLAKVRIAGSSPVARSHKSPGHGAFSRSRRVPREVARSPFGPVWSPFDGTRGGQRPKGSGAALLKAERADAVPPPDHLSAEAKRFWRRTLEDYDLEVHHVALLRMALEAWDRCQGSTPQTAA
jgi:hypothetical protein